MQSITQLEANLSARPNSIEISQALAEAYAKDGRWEEATKAYRTVVALYPTIAGININRIRLGAVALGISSFLFLIAELLGPPAFLFHPYDILDYLPANTISNILFLPILILLSCAGISIYKLLSISDSNLPAFWAMVLIVVGAGLYIPLFGINAVILPAAGNLYAKGEMAGFDVYHAVFEQPLTLIFTIGGYLLFVGMTIFNIVIWRSGYLSKLASTILWLGWSLFIVGDELLLILGQDLSWWMSNFMFFALLVTIGGIALALDVWWEAALQLAPTIDSLEKADS